MKISNLEDAVNLANKYKQTDGAISQIKNCSSLTEVKASINFKGEDDILTLPLSKTDLIACLVSVLEETEKELRKYGIYPDPKVEPAPQ